MRVAPSGSRSGHGRPGAGSARIAGRPERRRRRGRRRTRPGRRPDRRAPRRRRRGGRRGRARPTSSASTPGLPSSTRSSAGRGPDRSRRADHRAAVAVADEGHVGRVAAVRGRPRRAARSAVQHAGRRSGRGWRTAPARQPGAAYPTQATTAVGSADCRPASASLFLTARGRWRAIRLPWWQVLAALGVLS